MTSNIRHVLKLSISLVLLVLLFGCAAIGSDFLTEIMVQNDKEVLKSKTNHYKPIVLASNEDMIRIKYLSVGPNAEHEQVLKLITNHCDGSYIETIREEVEGWTTVEAECTQNTDS